MQVVYEDNHIIIVNKQSGEIVQGDKTGDRPLSDLVKDYIKEKYAKPGAVFLGVVHRLDRPVSGLVMFARTSKALTRLNKMFAEGQVHKTYWAIVKNRPKALEGTLENWLVRNEKQNKSYAYDKERPNAKKALLKYRVIGQTDNYTVLEVNLMTGRHHQIRCQLAAMGCPIKGDLKYGAPRSNPDGSISLMSRRVEFVHPVSKETIIVEAPLPNDPLWQAASTRYTNEESPEVVGDSGFGTHTAYCDSNRATLFAACAKLGGKEGGRHRLGENGHGHHSRTGMPGVPARLRHRGLSCFTSTLGFAA